MINKSDKYVRNLLFQQIKAVCPIEIFGIGDSINKATWTIKFAENATPAQRQAAQNVINNFNWTVEQTALNNRKQGFESDAGYIELLEKLRSASVAEIDTWLTNNVTTLTQARGVLAAIIKLLARDIINK